MKMEMILKIIGKRCRDFRLSLGLRQSDVADEMGYSKEAVSAFENGRANNAVVLLWYINHGFNGYYINVKGWR